MTASADNARDNPFTCLAIETAAGAGSVAACVGARVSSREFSGHPMQSREIYTAVRDILDELKLELTTADCIAFDYGPGAFTGLRVAAAVAQALAYGAGIPVARVSSLAALAAAASRLHGVDCVAPCLDARMGEAYVALYTSCRSDRVQAVVPDCLVSPGQYRLPSEDNFFAAGPGWSAHSDLVDNHAGQIIGQDFLVAPSAIDVLALAEGQFAAGRIVDAMQALPNYIRDKVTG